MNDTPEAPETAGAAPEADGWEWMIVEIFGHRRHAGRVREEERFGSKLLRIDIPNKGAPAEHGWTTHYYGGASIFSATPTDEATALRANKPYEPAGRYLPRFEDAEEQAADPAELFED